LTLLVTSISLLCVSREAATYGVKRRQSKSALHQFALAIEFIHGPCVMMKIYGKMSLICNCYSFQIFSYTTAVFLF